MKRFTSFLLKQFEGGTLFSLRRVFNEATQ